MGKIRSRRKAKSSKTSTQSDVLFFQSDAFGLDFAEFLREEAEGEEPTAVVKKALVMVEGKHIDSAKRVHVFSPERIQKIVRNTNRLLQNGGRVPWQKDHKKGQDDNIGDLEGQLEVRVITSADLPNPRLRHLIGKVGAFTNRLVAKGADVAEQVVAGRIKSLSPGIDIVTDTIREISATPTPAIVGLSTFSRQGKNQDSRVSIFNRAEFALTMQEAVQEQADEDSLKEEFEDLSEKFWTVVVNISNAGPEELNDQDPGDVLMQAVNDYAFMIQDLLGLTQEEGQQQQGMQPQMQPTSQQRGYAQMNRSEKLARFTMAGVERSQSANFKRGKDKKPRKKRGMGALGTAAAVAGGAAALGGLGYGASLGIRRAMAKNRIAQATSPAIAKKTNVMGDILQSDRNRVMRARDAVVGGAVAAKDSVVGGAKRTISKTRAGYRAGSRGSTGLGAVAKGSLGAAKGALRTTGGKAAAAGLGLAAAGAGYGAYRALKGRKKRR